MNFGAGADTGNDAAHRARNRTVMLTPDVTGQVRARLQQQEVGAALGNGENDFVSPARIAISMESPSAGQPSPIQPIQLGAPTPQPITHIAKAPAANARTDSAHLAPLVGFLVSFDRGPGAEYFELRSGRWIVTSENNGSTNNLLIEHETVSPMHAILRVSPNGTLQILDQLSEHGTQLKRFGATEVEQLSGDKANLEHGDIVTFGERNFYVCLITKSEE